MSVKNHVCSLSQAIKLYNLRVLQNSIFYYNQELTPKNPNMALYGYGQENIPIYMSLGKKSNLNKIDLNVHISGGDSYFFEYSAYDHTELAVMLDAFYETYRTSDNKWSANDYVESPHFDTPAEATAEYLIWMLENDERLTVDIANERLLNFYKNNLKAIK